MTELAVGNRVKLKNHVYFGVVQDGVLFDSGDLSFILKDKSTYPLVERLIALIDAGRPVESILEHAPGKLAAFFGKVLRSLEDHDMLVAVDADAPTSDQLSAHTASNELRKFLEDRLSGRSVDEALRRWRNANVVVVGGGRAMASAAHALAATGCARLTLASDGGAAAALEPLLDELESVHGLRAGVEALGEDAWLPDGAQLLVYASDSADVETASRIESAMRTAGTPGAIGAAFDGRACVLPASQLGRPGIADLLAWLPRHSAGGASLGPVAISLLGCVVAQAATCRFFDIEPEASRGQVAVISPDLEVEYRALVASASGDGAPLPFVHAPKYEIPEDRQLLPFEQIRIAIEPWFDPLLGPFSVADDDIQQVPLLQYPLRVRSAFASGGDQLVVGWGLEHADAVIRGLTQAVEVLGQSFLPNGNRVAAAFEEEAWKRRALAYAVADSSEMARKHRWAWVALDELPTAQARLLLRLLHFHVPQDIRMQIIWSPKGDAYVVRVYRGEVRICGSVASDPDSALVEGLGKACSAFQLASTHARRLEDPGPGPSELDGAAQAADWREALDATGAGRGHEAEFHLLTSPGFPPSVYCGYATLEGAMVSR